MSKTNKKFRKIVILDSVIFYPEHRAILKSLADEVVEYPSSLPESLERQFVDNPEMFQQVRCYTELGHASTPIQLLQNRIEGADVVISCWTCIPDELLKLNPQLKLIIFWTHEKEHRLNLSLTKKLGIEVQNIPDYGTDAVTEVVFAGLLELLYKNFRKNFQPRSGRQIALAVLHELFRHYRHLDRNEKRTRTGKFTHHFHKLGKAKFSFEEKSLDKIISEKLIARKSVAIVGEGEWTMLNTWLKAFEVSVDCLPTFDDRTATFYKTLSRNELIVLDSHVLPAGLINKIQTLFPNKLIDIADLQAMEYEVNKKTFGVIGLGRIGKSVMEKAQLLGFKTVATSKSSSKSSPTSLKSLEELLKISDVVSLHVPAHKADNLLDQNKVKLLKKGALFINTADGNAVDQKMLTKLMTDDKIHAFLDVYPGLPRREVLGLPMQDKTDWKIKKDLSRHVLAYRAGWKTQESIRVKTYELLGHLIDF